MKILDVEHAGSEGVSLELSRNLNGLNQLVTRRTKTRRILNKLSMHALIDQNAALLRPRSVERTRNSLV